MDYNLLGSSASGISQAKILQLAAIPYSRESSLPSDEIQVSCTDRRILYCWATRKTCALFTWDFIQFSSVQLLSRVQLFVTPWTAASQASLSITDSQRLPKHMSIELVRLSNHLITCHPLLLLPSIFPSIRVFSNESASSHQVAKVLEFQLQHQSFQWIPWIDLL